jgi:hypothetical protein
MASEKRKGEGEQKPAKPSVSDSFLWPRPVDPEEARRAIPAQAGVERSVVELTSPIGHRLRVRAPGSDSVISALPADEPHPPSKKKKRR